MEYRFENVRDYNRKSILEYQYLIGGRRCIGWGVLSLLLTLFYAAKFQSKPIDLVMISTCFALTVHYFSWPYRWVRKNEKKALKFYDGKLPLIYTHIGEQIVVEDIDSTFALAYSKIDKIISLKHGYYLQYAQKSVLMIDPNGFTKGTFEDFKQFLREKRPDLKIPE